MLVDRWNASPPPRFNSANSSRAAFRVLTTHNAASCPRICPATAGQSSRASLRSGHATRTRCRRVNRPNPSGMISWTFSSRSGMSGWSNAGCVAVQRTAVQPRDDASCPSIEHVGATRSGGSVWHSSSMTTLRATLCSLRQRPGLFENRLSKNCTLVVTTTGASQFSARGQRPPAASHPETRHPAARRDCGARRPSGRLRPPQARGG